MPVRREERVLRGAHKDPGAWQQLLCICSDHTAVALSIKLVIFYCVLITVKANMNDPEIGLRYKRHLYRTLLSY